MESIAASIITYLEYIAKSLDFDDHVSVVSSFLQRQGFEFLGAGISRAAFKHSLTPTLVYKVSYTGFDGHNEQSVWNRASSIQRTLMAECYYASNYVSVMEYIEGPLLADISKEDELKMDKEVIFFNVEKLFPSRSEFFDAHPENIIYSEARKRFIVIDYGV